jgi:hypothetical protein
MPVADPRGKAAPVSPGTGAAAHLEVVMKQATVMMMLPGAVWTDIGGGVQSTSSAAAFRAETRLSQMIHEQAAHLCKGSGLTPGDYREVKREPHGDGTVAVWFEVDCA